MKHLSFFLALSLLVLTPGTVLLGQEAPSLEKLQTRYEEIESLQASFVQVIGSDFAGDSTRIEGSVILAGNKYRVETPRETVVTNGETTWIYSPQDSQVVVNDADQQGSTVTPETFLTSSAEQYEIQSTRSTTRGGTPHSVLSLTATDPSSRFREATLWVRRSDLLVTRLRATDRNGSTFDLRLQHIDLNPSIDGNPFTFSAPQGVEVIDLRAKSQE